MMQSDSKLSYYTSELHETHEGQQHDRWSEQSLLSTLSDSWEFYCFKLPRIFSWEKGMPKVGSLATQQHLHSLVLGLKRASHSRESHVHVSCACRSHPTKPFTSSCCSLWSFSHQEQHEGGTMDATYIDANPSIHRCIDRNSSYKKITTM